MAVDTHQQITIPVAVGAIALLIGIGGTVFYFGGSLRQVDVNSANIARLTEEISKLPVADSGFREAHATLRARVDALSSEVDLVKRDLRPREFWEHTSSELGVVRAQVDGLVQFRDGGVREWTNLLQRVSALEAHYTDLAARSPGAKP